MNSNATKNEAIRTEAVLFFEWCRSDLKALIQALQNKDRQEYEAGRPPTAFVRRIKDAYRQHRATALPWKDHHDSVREALKNAQDLEMYMSCLIAEQHRLPKRILQAVHTVEKRKLRQNAAVFARKDAERRVRAYVRVWQSQHRAMERLIAEARGYKTKRQGGARVGRTEIDVERMFLSEAEAAGSAMPVRGLLPFIRSLWESEKTILVRKPGVPRRPSLANPEGGLERKVITNPNKSEPQLNRFLIKLGRALAAKHKRRNLPDWQHMDQTVRFVAHAWCENIIVDDEQWPMLCFFSTPALAQFLCLCNPPRWSTQRDPRTLERKIARLGLVRIPQGRIRRVKKKAGLLRFS